MHPPRVSVLLPYRNAEGTIREALESVLADRSAPTEIVVVNDGSSDGGPTCVEDLARREPRIRHVHTDGIGIARALAYAAAVARAPFLARMDGDDVSLPGRFGKQLDVLEDDPALGVVAARVECFPVENVGEGLRRYVSWQNALVTPEEHRNAMFVEAPVCHPAVMMRREALDRSGGYRSVPWPEDYDLWLRMDTAGCRFRKVPDVLLRWRHSDGRATFADARYALERFRDAKADHLAARLARMERPVVVWGAGPTGRRLARALESRGVRAQAFVDVDPRKLGRIARGATIVPPEALRMGAQTILAAVGARGARDSIRQYLDARGYREGDDYLCAA